MFPDSHIAQDFQCGSSKMAYLTTYGLAPYFEGNLLNDIKISQCGYTLHYDETTTVQTKKQMDLVIRYWSTKYNRIVIHYIGSIFFGHAKASTVSSKLLDFIADDNIPLNMLLSLSSDGPNVNKAIEAQMNKKLTECKLPTLLYIGSCNLHKVHNSCAKSLTVFGKDAEQLVIKLFYWFKHSAARQEDYRTVQYNVDLGELVLLRHVPTRWLTLLPAVLRVLSEWPAITKYFKDLPTEDKTVEKNEQYKEIKRLIDNPRTYVQLQFVADVCPMFTRFLQDFQHEGCMIHVLYPALRDLVVTIMLRFLKTDVVGNKTGRELQNINVRDVNNMLPLEQVEIGAATKQAMTKMVKVEQHKGLLMEMRNFFTCCTEYMQKNLPLDNGFLTAVVCLQPGARTLTLFVTLMRFARIRITVAT